MSKSCGNNQRDKRRGRRDTQLIGEPKLCPVILWTLPLPSNLSLHHKTKHRKTPHRLAHLPVGFLHTGLPSFWDLVCSWQELHRQSPPAVPEMLPCPAMVSEPLSRLRWTKRAVGSCPHLIKGLIFSTFCEGINTVGHRTVSIKGSADLACSGTGSSIALSPQYSAQTSPGVYKALLLH